MQHSEIWGAFMHNKPLLSDHLLSCVCTWVCACVQINVSIFVCCTYVGVCVCTCHWYIRNRCFLCCSLLQCSLKAILITTFVLLQVSIVAHQAIVLKFWFGELRSCKSFHLAEVMYLKVKPIINLCSLVPLV